MRGELEAALDPAELRRCRTDALHEPDRRGRVRRPADAGEIRAASQSGVTARPHDVEVLSPISRSRRSVRLTSRRLERRELLVLHPAALEREADGTIARLGRDAVGATRESYIYAELRQLVHDEERSALEHELNARSPTRYVVGDHTPMLAQLREHAGNLEARGALPGGLSGCATWSRSTGLEAKNFLSRLPTPRRSAAGAAGGRSEPASGLGPARRGDSRFAEAGAEAPAAAGRRAADDER